MKVTMRAEISGTRNGVDWPKKGGEIDLPDQEAADMCAAGLAEPVAAPEQPRKAVAKKAEKRG